MYHYCIAAFLSLSAVPVVQAQEIKPVKFANGNFIPSNNLRKTMVSKQALAPALMGNQYFVLLQFDVLPAAAEKNQLAAAGIVLGDYLPGNAFMASINSQADFSSLKRMGIVSINLVPPFYKIDRQLLYDAPVVNKEDEPLAAVSYFAGADKEIVTAALQKAGAVIVPTKFTDAAIVFIQRDKQVLDAVAAIPLVTAIRLQPMHDKPLNYKNIGAHAVSGLNAATGKNLNGRGVTLGIGDNADISTHDDFTGRIINRSPWVPARHGTHVAGTAAGAGIINVKNHGMAPKATIVNQFFSDIIINSPAYIADYGMVLTNNSYYSSQDDCPGNGEYDLLSNYVDGQMKTYKELLHVVASGNDGTKTCSPFISPYGTVKSGWQAAKNVLTVGAINTLDYKVAPFSSSGPANDGRIKPEITAGGWAVLSTYLNNTYGNNWGTSMACPTVTGAVALMYERYRQLHGGQNPKSALMKALVCNTAEDLGNTGPDYIFGFGMLNARRAVQAIDSVRYIVSNIANGGSNNHSLTVPPGLRRIKIMLYWADAAASSIAAAALVNDLDVKVATPAAATHRPLVLNPNPAAVSNPATEGFDHTNNIEQVVIDYPAAGVYSINVNGFSVPQGPQEYVVTYEYQQQEVVVEYPAGGEKLVPGEMEIIRWSAYGNEANTFTIEYSQNNGTSWNIINNNVAADSMSYSTWQVPAAITSNALIRVSRNGTGLSGQSKEFTVLGEPNVAAANVCEGAVLLTWPPVTGAEDYDILQLTADSMKVIANTTDTFYIATGLNKYKKYWLGAAAKNNGIPGRRSISVNVLPNSGACSLNVFNNDLKVDSILEPNTARQQFANAADATAPVKILIKNAGSVATAGAYNVLFSYAGNTITETVNTIIPPGGSLIYTFTGSYAAAVSGYRYDFKAWVTKADDANHANDTAYKAVKYINNDAISALPLTENFEAMPAAEYTRSEMAIGENKHLDFFTDTSTGRARTFVNTGFALNGSNALTLDQWPASTRGATDSLIFNYNMQPYINKQLRLEFFYRNHGQADAPGNRVWVRGNENNAWVEAYNLFSNQAELGQWQKGIININDALGSAIPVQNISSTFQIKFGQQGKTSANSAAPVIDIDDGYTFDNITLDEAINDAALLKINSPGRSGCGLTASTPVNITVKNYNNAALNNVQVNYRINNGPVVTQQIASIAANQSLNFTFSQLANFSAYTDYSLDVWVKHTGDSYASNDSILLYTFHNSPVISTYPYLQNFENNDGNFYTKGSNTTWEWGSPVAGPGKAVISNTASGDKAWITNLSGNYNDNETSYLITPCFDLNGLTNPVLSFSHIFEVEQDYDYTWVEYSTDGVTWLKLGTTASGTNWYDNIGANNWRLSKTKWHVASLDIPVTATNVRFRFVLSSDGGVTKEGIGIDDVRVHEKAAVQDASFPVIQISQPVTANGWVPFTSGNKILAEIKSNGQNLGNVTLLLYPNGTTAVRHANDTYYLDRNCVIRSSAVPVAPINIRLYFSDSEVNKMMNASGCPSCKLPEDAYELNVTRYKGTAADENGSLQDNYGISYQLIQPLIVPHGNGYYAEFSTNVLGEYWIGAGLIKPLPAGNCPGDVISFTAAGSNGNTYQWQHNTGNGYTNLNDGPNYNGTGNDTLQVINLPSSATGYKYRCLVNGVAGGENILRFISLWTGVLDTNWFNAANWSCNAVPDQYTDAVIPGTSIYFPLVNAAAMARTVYVQPGASVTVSPGVSIQLSGR